jgi:hypothetical protein
MNSTLSDFVCQALAQNVSREKIAESLHKGGWTSKEINTALDAFVESDMPVPVPRKRVSGSPKETFIFLMLFATLYAAAFQLGSILFDLINLSLPQPGEFAQHSIVSLRYGIAFILTAFPIFLFMLHVTARENLQNPGQRISPARRWLTYLTLFIASITIITDLISLIVQFLEGDLTLRFGLKVLVVAILAGCAFIHYLRDLRRDEVAPSIEITPTRTSRFAIALLTIIVAAVIGSGLWFTGSPMKARLQRQDQQRISDLQRISTNVNRFYSDKGSLPVSLMDCDSNPITYISHKTDAVSGERYGYRVVDKTHFQLSATFALSGNPNTRSPFFTEQTYFTGQEEFFRHHHAGTNTFNINALRKDKTER